MTNPTGIPGSAPALADVAPHEVEGVSAAAASLPRIVNHLRKPENETDFVAIADDVSPRGTPAEAVIVSAGYFAKLLSLAEPAFYEGEFQQEAASRVAQSDEAFAKHRAAGTAPAETDMDALFPAKG